MKFKYRIKEAFHFLGFAFYPKTTLVACAVFSTIIFVILGIMMLAVPQDSSWYDIIFALTTGSAGSFFVTFVVELTTNYRHNKLAWHELQDYYSAIMEYEGHKQVMMQLTPLQRARKKAHEEFVAAGGTDEIDADDEPKDSIQITWEKLPDIIPVLRQTLDEKKEFLSDAEINELKKILSEYEQIRFEVRNRILMSPMTYDALNHPDEEYLTSIYPLDVIENMPQWIRKYLSSKESQKACDLYADAILSDSFLLLQFMKDYDISQKGLDGYQDEVNRLEDEEESVDVDCDVIASDEPEDEEAFRAQNEDLYKYMELERRSFVSWHLSRCCQIISECVDSLEKSILKKPYYGMMIESHRKASKEPIDDILSQKAYENEKTRLEKKLTE